AALVAIDPKNGQILAMVGSKNYFDKSIDGEVNVTMRPRQPGSSFKPFAYAKAFEKGFQPETMVLDAQTNFGPDGSGRNYVPRNYDGRFHGVISMRE
ncbi:MAG TPA: penicillin-binding protein, partial [Candidatus Moranbacteria bacterium]|nr:penicillin-binding protein [Candidatus Moranbacteria bacterium]